MVNNNILIGLYEKALPSDMPWKEKLHTAKTLGFDYIEMSIDETEEKIARLDDDMFVHQMQEFMKDTNMMIGSICLSALRRYALGSENENLRIKGLNIAKRAIDLSVNLGIRFIQLPGYDVFYEEGNEKTKEIFIHNLNELCQYAAARGVLLGFETMENAFMDTIEKAMFYINKIKSPYLQLYPDVGNLSNAMRLYHTSMIDDLRLGKGHILALHLKESREFYYRNLNYGEGDCDFDIAIETALSIGVRRFVCELWYQNESNWYDILKRNCKYMLNCIEQHCQKENGR